MLMPLLRRRDEYGIVLVLGVYHAKDNDLGRINAR